MSTLQLEDESLGGVVKATEPGVFAFCWCNSLQTNLEYDGAQFWDVVDGYNGEGMSSPSFGVKLSSLSDIAGSGGYSSEDSSILEVGRGRINAAAKQAKGYIGVVDQ